MKYILYCAIRKKRLIYDTLYSILTLFHATRITENITIVIFTDQANSFYKEMKGIEIPSKFSIKIEEISLETIKNWTKNGDIFNVKIYSIKQFFLKYKQNVLFLDSDMYLVNNLAPIFELIESNQFVMYNKRSFNLFEIMNTTREDLGNLEDNVVTSNGMIILKDSKYSIPFDCATYESGVIGINYKYKDIIDEVIDFYVDFYRSFGYENSEEISFGYVFQNISKICLARGILNHYSNLDFIRYIIAYSLKTFFDNDKYKLEEVLNHYNISISDLNKMVSSYDDVKYFLLIFKLFVFKENLQNSDILLCAMGEQTISNFSVEKSKLLDVASKFKSLLNL